MLDLPSQDHLASIARLRDPDAEAFTHPEHMRQLAGRLLAHEGALDALGPVTQVAPLVTLRPLMVVSARVMLTRADLDGEDVR